MASSVALPRSTSARRARSRTPAPSRPNSGATRPASRLLRSTTTRPIGRENIADQQQTALDVAVAPVDGAFTAVLDDTARQDALRAAIPALTTASKETLAGLNQVQWTALRGEMTRVLDATEHQEVRDALLADVRGSLSNRIANRFGADQRALAGEILSPLVIANSTFDAAATERARDDAANRVDPVQFSVQKGEVIVPRGQAIDDLTREKLNAFGLLDPQPDPARAGGWLLLATLTVALLLGWIWRFRPQIWHRTPALLLVALVLVVTVLAMKATGDRSVLPYVIPTAAVGLLLAVLLDAGAALIVTGMLALLGGAIVGNVEFATLRPVRRHGRHRRRASRRAADALRPGRHSHRASSTSSSCPCSRCSATVTSPALPSSPAQASRPRWAVAWRRSAPSW